LAEFLAEREIVVDRVAEGGAHGVNGLPLERDRVPCVDDPPPNDARLVVDLDDTGITFVTHGVAPSPVSMVNPLAWPSSPSNEIRCWRPRGWCRLSERTFSVNGLRLYCMI